MTIQRRREGRASEETRPVVGGKTDKGFNPEDSLGRELLPVKFEVRPRVRKVIALMSPREIFLEYCRAFTTGFKRAVKAEKKENIFGPDWDAWTSLDNEKVRWAALFTLCRMFNWKPQDLGIQFFGNQILGPTMKTTKILLWLVLWLTRNQMDELFKGGVKKT